MATAPPRIAELLSRLKSIGERERGEIDRNVPKVLRRVGGYNIDVCCPQSERPYTDDGSVNYAHLLVGSEGTLAWSRKLTLKLLAAAVHRTLGVVNFPTLYKAMESARHLVRLSPSAVELVDRTMIELARGNPAFRPVIDKALVGEPDAILLVEFSGESRDGLRASFIRARDARGRSGIARQRRRDDGCQRPEGAVGRAQGGPQHHDEHEGRRQAGVVHRGLRGSTAHLAEYVDRLTQVFARHGTRGTWYAHASVGTLHVRPILDMRRDGAKKMRAIAEEASALVREYKGAFSGEHGDGLVRTEWVGWQFGPRLSRAFEEIKDLFDPAGLMNPGKIVRGTKMDDASLFRFPPGYRVQKLAPALDWSAWNVQSDAATGSLTAAGHGRRSGAGVREGRRHVQQQRALPQVRHRHDVSQLPGDARRGSFDARSCEHAASGAVGQVRSRRTCLRCRVGGARSLRELQGMPARMPDRRRHGEDEDRGAEPAAAEARHLHARSTDRGSPAVGAARGAGVVASRPA
jgi:hypothetical protein